MRVNVIYDNRHNDDLDRLADEFKRQGIHDYKIWEAIIDRPTVVESINASHKMIVRWAKENNLKEVCIAEQDVFFPTENGWSYYLNHKPKEYDLYLGGTYLNDLGDFNRVCGFHLYMVREQFYDVFLAIDDLLHIDTAIDEIRKSYNFKVCRPFVALQRAGFSANNQAHVDYNVMLNEKYILK
jgi:hypothetical protein